MSRGDRDPESTPVDWAELYIALVPFYHDQIERENADKLKAAKVEEARHAREDEKVDGAGKEMLTAENIEQRKEREQTEEEWKESKDGERKEQEDEERQEQKCIREERRRSIECSQEARGLCRILGNPWLNSKLAS